MRCFACDRPIELTDMANRLPVVGALVHRECYTQGARREPLKGASDCVSGLDVDERRLEEHGCAAYLRKPVDHDKLVDTVLAVAKATS